MTHNADELTRRELLALGGAGAVTLATTGLGTSTAHAEDKKEDDTPQVPRRKLGKTGKSIPILLFGAAVDLDPRFDPKLAEALRYGVNYIDAADCYGGGTCESAVGNFHTRAKLRDKIWITSKSDAHDPAGFEKTLERSLKALKTDYVDMYYLHALKDGDYLNKDMAKTVERLKKAGKIKHFGFSCHSGTVVELMNKAAGLPWIESIMFRYNFRQYGNKELNDAIDKCAKANIGLIAMKTQGSEASFRTAWKKFEQTGKWNKHQAVLKAVWEDDRITAAVSHMDTMGKLRENIAAACDKDKLGALDRKALEQYAAATRNYACDGCDHICNARVDAPVQIGDTMRFLMYHDGYDEKDKALRLFKELPAEAQRLSGIDFRQAAAACPNNIDIVAHMERAAKLFNA